MVLCRMDSSRLPGKVLRRAGGVSLLECVVRRVQMAPSFATGVVVATSDRGVDDPIEQAANDLSVPVFRGSASNVAQRFLNAAQEFALDWAARVNADSPWVDPPLLEQAADLAREGRTDFVTNLVPRTFPYGVAVELVRVAAYARLLPTIQDDSDREHPTKMLYRAPESVRYLPLTCPLGDLSGHTLTVDDPPDLEAFERDIADLGADWLAARYPDVIRVRQGRTDR